MSFINCVLSQPRSWSVQTYALLLRSRWEKGNTRRLQRSLAQLEELVNQFRRPNVPASVRLPLVHTVPLPPHWIIEQELGKLLDEIGAVSSALEVYLRLQAWDNVIACYAKLGHREKAEKLIRDQLAKCESANLWCYLGDVTRDPEHYHRAWDVSQGHSSRAQRALAYYYFGRREVKKSLEHFEKSLQVSPLQITVWFTYGCAALECEEFSLATTAFRRCVNLDSDNFAAWSNLATAYIKANNKPRAFVTYQEALKCDYENWRIWENFLAVAVDVGEFDEGIRAYHRLLELRDKHTDVPVLTVLVRVVNEGIIDASGESAARLRPKLLQLFGHITAKVTSCADVWRLYGELLIADSTADLTTHERAVQCLRSAHSCATMAANWEKDIVKCTEISKLSHQLAQAYQLCMSCITDSEHLSRIKSSGRLALKGVIAKIRRQNTDALTGVLHSDLLVPVEELEHDLHQFS
jgi:tetratricopeptide (TPR) repeat protein